MAETVSFHGILKSAELGEPTSAIDLDFSEGWPEVTRQRFKMPASTAAQTINLGGIATAKVLAIEAPKDLTVRVNGATAGVATTCRGLYIAKISSATLILTNTSSWTGGQSVYIYAAGL